MAKPKTSLDVHEPSNCKKRATAQTHVSLDNESKDIVLNCFSDLGRLLRVTSWMQRFITNCRTEHSRGNHRITFTREEIAAAEKYWIKLIQAGSFPNGVREESLLRLSPMVDSDGIVLSVVEDSPDSQLLKRWRGV